MLFRAQPSRFHKFINHFTRGTKRALNGLSLYKKFNINDTIAIFGAPRSGTTWLSDLINVKLEYLTIFRPMSVSEYPNFKKICNEDRPYCHPDTDNKELEEYLYKVFSGDYQTLKGGEIFYIRMNEYYARLKAKKLLIKFNTGIRLLPWINKRFKLGNLFLVSRHPCATISSQIQAGGRVGYDSIGHGFPDTKMIINEIKKMEFIEASLIDKVAQASHIEERLAVIWALDYLIPFKFDKSLDVICYENLLLNSEIEISRLFEKLDQINYLDHAKKVVHRPGITTEKEDIVYLSNIESQLNKWKKRLSREEVSRISKVLRWFEMGFMDNEYYILDNQFHQT